MNRREGPMLIGAHAIIYSRRPEADRAFFRDVLGLAHADAGDGWLIFALPPSELAVHPGRRNDVHEIYLQCSDVEAFVRRLRRRWIRCGPVQDLGWGRLAQVRLPGGGQLGIYEPQHPRPARRARSPSRQARSRARPGS